MHKCPRLDTCYVRGMQLAWEKKTRDVLLYRNPYSLDTFHGARRAVVRRMGILGLRFSSRPTPPTPMPRFFWERGTTVSGVGRGRIRVHYAGERRWDRRHRAWVPNVHRARRLRIRRRSRVRRRRPLMWVRRMVRMGKLRRRRERVRMAMGCIAIVSAAVAPIAAQRGPV